MERADDDEAEAVQSAAEELEVYCNLTGEKCAVIDFAPQAAIPVWGWLSCHIAENGPISCGALVCPSPVYTDISSLLMSAVFLLTSTLTPT